MPPYLLWNGKEKALCAATIWPEKKRNVQSRALWLRFKNSFTVVALGASFGTTSNPSSTASIVAKHLELSTPMILYLN